MRVNRSASLSRSNVKRSQSAVRKAPPARSVIGVRRTVNSAPLRLRQKCLWTEREREMAQCPSSLEKGRLARIREPRRTGEVGTMTYNANAAQEKGEHWAQTPQKAACAIRLILHARALILDDYLHGSQRSLQRSWITAASILSVCGLGLSTGDCRSNYNAFHRLLRRSTLRQGHAVRTLPICGQSTPKSVLDKSLPR